MKLYNGPLNNNPKQDLHNMLGEGGCVATFDTKIAFCANAITDPRFQEKQHVDNDAIERTVARCHIVEAITWNGLSSFCAFF